MSEPPEKKQKLGEEEEDEATAKVEKNGHEDPGKPAILVPQKTENEKDGDAVPPADRIKDPIQFLPNDTTLNFLQSSNNRLVMSMNEGGIQHLLAGARANLGVKSGRYYFEVKIVEMVNGSDSAQAVVRPKTVVRIGFSKAASSVLLGTSDDSVCFDAEGVCLLGKNRACTFGRAGRETTLGVLLNLENGSENYNTVSLFRDGHRATQPQPLPETFKDELLYPHITFRNVTLQINFGSSPICPLPFKCNMLSDASKKNTSITKPTKLPKGKKYEVVYPIGLPDEGTFDALDLWLQDHPDYLELSDRMILDWIEQSGIRRPHHLQLKTSNDKPEMHFQVREFEDGSIKQAIFALAPLMERNYVVMEVCDNLLPDARTQSLSLFPAARFTKTALVSVGEPNEDYLDKAKELVLKAKKEASDRAFRSQKLMAKAKQEAAKRKRLEEKAKAEAKAKAEGKEEAKEEDEEVKEEEIPDVDMDEEPPQVELTADEEEAIRFIHHDVKDLTPFVLSGAFSRFALPTKAEGFDVIKYNWENEPSSKEYLKNWIAQKKLTLRADDLQPGLWAAEQQRKWLSDVALWHTKANEYKATFQKKEQEKQQAKRDKEIAAARAQVTGEKVEEEEAKEETTDAAEEEPLDFGSVDVFGAEDILDVGQQTPLFKEFGHEDWALMALRFRLHLLAHAFKRDIKDPERPGIFLDHLPFYFNRYFKEPLSLHNYGVESMDDLVKLVADTAYVSSDRVLESQISEELETFNVFVKLTEEARRLRTLRLEMGDDTAKVQIIAPQGKSNHKKGGGKTGGDQQKGYWATVGKGKTGSTASQAPPAGKGLVPTITAGASSPSVSSSPAASTTSTGGPIIIGPPSAGKAKGKGKDKGKDKYGYAAPSYSNTVGGAAAAAATAAAAAPVGSGGPIGGGYSKGGGKGPGAGSSYSYGKSSGKPGYASKGSSPYAPPSGKGKGKAGTGMHVPPPRR